MKIRVYGSGCKSCKKLYETVQIAIRESGIAAQAEYVSDMAEIAKSGVMSMPALEIDGQIKSAGKVLNKAEVLKLFDAV